MKKFFELSVVSRKSVEGKSSMTVDAFSANSKHLGKFITKVISTDTDKGIFVKYVPSDNTSSDTEISDLQFVGENQESINDILKAIKNALENSAATEPISAIIGIMLASRIDLDTNEISVANLGITNETIYQYLNDEWIGIKVSFLPEIFDTITSLPNNEYTNLIFGK